MKYKKISLALILAFVLSASIEGDGIMTTPAEQIAIASTTAQVSSFYVDKIGQIWVSAYGAVGDGVTDDTLAVQAAVDAAIANGSYEVFFVSGKTYKVTALTNTIGMIFTGNNVTITGGASIVIDSQNAVLKSKKGYVAGDSIAWGQVQATPPYVTGVNWVNTFAQITQASMTNGAIGGTCMATVGNTDIDPNAFCNLVDTVDFSSYDFLFIAYAINDYSYHVPMGSNGTYTKSTFKGALNYVLKKLDQTYPTLKVTLLTPMYGGGYATTRNGSGLLPEDYANAIIDVAAIYNKSVINLYHNMGVNGWNFQQLYWDGSIHPNAGLQVKMGEYIAQRYPGEIAKAKVIWKPLTLVNGATIYSEATKPSYYIDPQGFVHFRGLIVLADNIYGISLPAEARPSYAQTLIALTGDGTLAYSLVQTAGGMSLSTINKTYDLASIPAYYVGAPDVVE